MYILHARKCHFTHQLNVHNCKKYCMQLGCLRLALFDLVCLQYSSSVRKMHSPSTRTTNSTLGLKRPTLTPYSYTIFYFILMLNLILMTFIRAETYKLNICAIQNKSRKKLMSIFIVSHATLKYRTENL